MKMTVLQTALMCVEKYVQAVELVIYMGRGEDITSSTVDSESARRPEGILQSQVRALSPMPGLTGDFKALVHVVVD
ncbi:hypothetical protein PoB_006126600 [Plakobranchus ocellatus]|uniref:Uncharacterized protein n=1 Tax=Plakobranchus ocellatus TaxID=259542 RepID=A0AAV4CSC7_9GAST|nr:hypothetical protein PoB_006126600 [Plakobranchus ocellatus]